MTTERQQDRDQKTATEKMEKKPSEAGKAIENAAADAESLAMKAKDAGAAALASAEDVASDLRPKAAAAVKDAAEAGREGAAAAIDRAALSLEGRVEGTGAVPEKAGEYAVEGMHAAAGYLKDRDTAEIVEEAEQYVKTHPMRSVAVAVVAGFFVGRMLR